MLRGRRSGANNISGKGQALAAFRFATKARVHIEGTPEPATLRAVLECLLG